MVNYDEMRRQALERKKILEKREAELANQRLAIDHETQEIRRELLALARILEGLDLGEGKAVQVESVGLTDHIRRILQQAATPITPIQIRDALLVLGVRATSPKHLLISVHTILGKLVASGEVEPAGDIEFGGGYRWRRSGIEKLQAGYRPRADRGADDRWGRLIGRPARREKK